MFKANTTWDIIGLGEVMLRLSPTGRETLAQGGTFEKNIGGSELNVISGAARFGAKCAMLTKFPDNVIGHFAAEKVRAGCVDDSLLAFDRAPGARLGLYYYESGAYPRKSSVVYDRAGSSVRSFEINEIPESVYENTKIFHVSGITLALGGTLRKTAIEAIKRFHEGGARISFDVNYRAALWSEEEARSVIEQVFPYVDFLFVSEETSRRMLQRTGTLEDILKGYAADYGCTVVASTKRQALSPTRHNFGSLLYCDGKFYTEPPYESIEVVDRIGSGDAYLSGVLYGLLATGDAQKALEYGNAASSVKNTVMGDMTVNSRSDIEGVIRSHKAEGPQDELNR